MIQHADLSMLHNLPSPVRARVLLLFLMLCVAWGWTGATAAHAAEQGKVKSAGTVMVAPVEEVQELKERVKELEARERQLYAMEIEDQRKKVDWWLSFLGIMLAGLAIFVTIAGAAIPYLVVRRSRNIIEQDKKIIEQDKVQVRAWLDEIERLKHKASEDSEAIHKQLEIVSGTPESLSDEVQQTAKKTAEDETAEPLLRLRAKAVEASHSSNAQEAFILWSTLADLDAHDANAYFNAGYWAYVLGEEGKVGDKISWLKLAEEKYKHAFTIYPDSPDTANNWGAALAAEAKILFDSDLAAARELSRAAREKYQLALTMKPDKHEVINNWGNALAAEAIALFDSDPAVARDLWSAAREKYQQALTLQPDSYDTANNWGISLANEAKAIFASDPAEARDLWRAAGEKYQQALVIKPDLHKVANDWATALLAEANAIAQQDDARFWQLVGQAEQLLLLHSDAAPGEMAYNLACVFGLRNDVQSCLKWLKVAQEHKTLMSCEHMQIDPDLKLVRNDPAFIAWFNQVCPA